ncbi:hypothetical protein Tco_0930650, partial [Tanacetum coccineum]
MGPIMFDKGQKECEHQKNQTSDDKYQWHRPEARTSQILRRTAEGEGHVSPSEHPEEKGSLDTPAKLTRAKLNKRSRDADLSKDMSCPESPPELRRSWRRRIKIRRNQADPDIYPELQWERQLSECKEMTRRFNTRSILGGKSTIRTIDVGLLWMSSTKRLGASVDEFRYADRLVMFKAPPVGNPQCSQLP